MKIINLIKTEFIKNFSIKKLIISTIILFISSFIILKLTAPDTDLQTLDVASGNAISEEQYNNLLNKKYKTLEDEYDIARYQYYIDLNKSIIEKKIAINDWKFQIRLDVIDFKLKNFLIDKLKNNPDNEEIKSACEVNTEDDLSYKIYDLCNNYTIDELTDLYNKNEQKYNDYKKLFEEDKYYLYLKYEVEQGNLESNELIENIINKKIAKGSDILLLNYLQYSDIEDITTSKEQQHKKLKQDNEAFKAILIYSSTHNIPHDIEYNYWNYVDSNDTYMTTKKAVNQVYHLSFVILIIMSITCSGIVSNEHSKGTIKNIITTPVRRWKVLLSKFIYLVLNTYLLWFIGLITISLIAGLKYGFSDLFTPKLIYESGKVIEVNYYLYTIKMMLLASIPLISFLSIQLFISTISLNTSLTVGVTSVLGVLAPIVWLMSVAGNIKQIVYTPLWYFDCGFMFNNDFHYIETMLFKNVYFDLSTGIISSIIVIIVLYVITNIVYTKRDIKS